MIIKRTWKGYRIGDDNQQCQTIIITPKRVICITKDGNTETNIEFLEKIEIIKC